MKKYFIGAGAVAAAALAAYLSLGTSDQNTIVENALAPSDCPALTFEVTFGKRYEGPLIDTHIHIPHPPEHPLDFPVNRPVLGKSVTLGDYRCVFESEGIVKAFVFFPVFPGFEATHLAVVKGATERYGDLIVPFIMPPDDDGSADGFPTVTAQHLLEMLSVYPGIFRGYGEIGLYARGDHDPKGAPALPPDSDRLNAIYTIVRANNLLVYFHLGEGQQQSFEKTLAANRDINFIFHGDQLIAYESEQNLEALDEILSRHPNAYYGIDELYGDTWLLQQGKTKEEFMAHFEDYTPLLKEDVRTWKAFIERHPHQVLWGTDRGVEILWSMDREVGRVLTRYARTFINLLDPAVQERFAYKNAERLIGF